MLNETQVVEAINSQIPADSKESITFDLIQRHGAKIGIVSVDGNVVGQIRIESERQEKLWSNIMKSANHMWLNYDEFVGM